MIRSPQSRKQIRETFGLGMGDQKMLNPGQNADPHSRRPVKGRWKVPKSVSRGGPEEVSKKWGGKKPEGYGVGGTWTTWEKTGGGVGGKRWSPFPGHGREKKKQAGKVWGGASENPFGNCRGVLGRGEKPFL